MAERFGLDGGMIPRTVKRLFDQRGEPREDRAEEVAVLGLRGRKHAVRLVNLSSSGAMVIFDGLPHIGETVSLQRLDEAMAFGQVRWVRDGRIGIGFAAPRE